MTDPGTTQKLAAVLAADVAGYSRLMQGDEHATVAALDECREIFRERIEANDGRVVDMAGDSVLAVFERASAAVTAALEAQERLRARNDPLPDDRRMRYRIGVNLGEVVAAAPNLKACSNFSQYINKLIGGPGKAAVRRFVGEARGKQLDAIRPRLSLHRTLISRGRSQ